ncbi:MAG: hypothetical protein EOM04_08735 [Clostridia bacterium]|nr:hypothetical protein [Clostridia bacterium]
MLNIRKIKIENFRGIKSPIDIDFVKGGKLTSALIYGRNGTGKSSIIDAWEWLINKKIESLSKDGINENDYPHVQSHGDNVYIEIELSDQSTFSVKATFDKSKITIPNYSSFYQDFKSHAIYPNYLRYSDLQQFVYKTKGEKYNYIAKYFGLESFAKKQADLQKSAGKIELIYQDYSRQHAENIKKIVYLTEHDSFDEKVIVNCINAIAEKYKIGAISQFNEAFKTKNALSEIVNTNPIANELAEWKAFKQRVDQFYRFPIDSNEIHELELKFKELKEDEANIKNLILLDLYSAASNAIIKIDNKSQCPVCDQEFDGDLEHYIFSKKEALNELNKKRLNFIRERDSIIEKIELIYRNVLSIQLENSENVKNTLKPIFEDFDVISKKLPEDLVELKKDILELSDINLETKEEFLAIENLRLKKEEYFKSLDDRIRVLSENEEAKNLAINFDKLIQILSSYTIYLKNQSKVEYLSTISRNMSIVLAKLTLFIQTQIQNIFAVIEEDVISCYNFLESSNQYLKNPAIKLVTGRDKAIELEIEFADKKITPAYKYMSESQVNSFGLSIFLAATKYFNSTFKFIILDDIVNSFDAFKRPKVSQLIANRFSDFQILMLTHDQIFFDTVQKDFPQWNRYKFTGWDLTTGPRCILSRNYIEEIQKLIEEDDPIGAGQKLGRYLELVLATINQCMQTPIQYKLENVYTLAEFYNPLVKRFKEKLKLDGKVHKINRLFGEFEQGTIFRNYCAHFKNEQTQFTTDEIDAVFKKWLEIEDELYCPKCKSYCAYESSSKDVFIKCNCGLLDLKEEGKYM